MKQRLMNIFRGLLTAYCLLLTVSTCFAAVPHLIRYQGTAVDTQGTPLEGPYTLTFRLYSAETGGTALWTETQPSVPLTKGQFSILLGQITSLQSVDWTQPLWLSVQVNGEPELAPRQRITSVPLAVTAERLAGPLATSSLSDDAHTLVPAGAIILWDGAACPAGYTRLAGYDNKFLVGSGTAGTAGGSNTHTHSAGSYSGPSHTHVFATTTKPNAELLDHAVRGNTGSGNVVAVYNGHLVSSEGGFGTGTVNNVVTDTVAASGTGPVTGASASADSRPEFMTIILCRKD